MLTVQNVLLLDEVSTTSIFEFLSGTLKRFSVRHTNSLPSQGNTSFECVRLTSPSVEPQPEFNLDLPLMSSSTIIPVSAFSTLTSALTAGAHVVDYRARSPSFSAVLPAASAVYLHISPTRDQLSTFSTLHGAVDSE
jgi:hypothetical protein